MDKLKGSQKKYLRAQAHHLKPLVIIGAKGVTGQLIGSVDLALKDHELIKVKFGEFKEAKKEISEEIATSHQKRTCRPHRQHRHFLPPKSESGKKKN